jgi:hypothetical protein
MATHDTLSEATEGKSDFVSRKASVAALEGKLAVVKLC